MKKKNKRNKIKQSLLSSILTLISNQVERLCIMVTTSQKTNRTTKIDL